MDTSFRERAWLCANSVLQTIGDARTCQVVETACEKKCTHEVWGGARARQALLKRNMVPIPSVVTPARRPAIRCRRCYDVQRRKPGPSAGWSLNFGPDHMWFLGTEIGNTGNTSIGGSRYNF